ncbi:hypothetical protein KFE25_010000 [Diacronema lutheri]|uniref:Bromo domain-containing protein n=2 Tax=Diacronema lutheri TaxID=2081491 RepID=A0A8J6C7M3_DIALT|nr:hypothetical protein KFE25_010000 [Diacronema lutheri]
MAVEGLSVDQLRDRLLHLGDELPDEVVSASWLRDGRERWMAELQHAREPAELAQCSLHLEKCIKRRAQPKWWRHERPIWVQGLLALARSSQDGLAPGCEPERLLQQLLLTLGKLVRTLDLSALGAFTPAVDAARKRAEEMRDVIRADESGEVVHGDAPVVDFFLQRKRRRLQPGDALLPPAALRRLHRLARQPTAELLAVAVLADDAAADGERGSCTSAWTRLLSTRLTIHHGGIGTLHAGPDAPDHDDDDRPEVVCAPDSMLLALDDAIADVPAYLLRAVCERALRALARADGIVLFELPIEEAIRSCPMPGYELRVRSKRLLDLGQIADRLKAAEGGYASLADFRHDMRDLFQNAIDYHGPRATARAERGVGSTFWIARIAAELHARLERALPLIVEEVRPRTCSYLCPADALPRPWAVLELTHAAQSVSSAGFLRDLPVTVIGEMRDACLGILQHVQREVAERLRQGPAVGV